MTRGSTHLTRAQTPPVPPRIEPQTLLSLLADTPSLFSPPQSHVTAGSRPCTVCRKPARRAGCVQSQAARGNVKSSDLHPHHRQHCCNSQTRPLQAVRQSLKIQYSLGGVTAPLISPTTKPRGEVPAMHCTSAGGGVNVAVNAVYP